jgi:hypothetical protein
MKPTRSEKLKKLRKLKSLPLQPRLKRRHKPKEMQRRERD